MKYEYKSINELVLAVELLEELLSPSFDGVVVRTSLFSRDLPEDIDLDKYDVIIKKVLED